MIFTVEQNMMLADTDRYVTGLKVNGEEVYHACFQFDESEGWADVYEHSVVDGRTIISESNGRVIVKRLHGRVEVTRGKLQ